MNHPFQSIPAIRFSAMGTDKLSDQEQMELSRLMKQAGPWQVHLDLSLDAPPPNIALMLRALRHKDFTSYRHSVRVAYLSRLLSQQLGFDQEQADTIWAASLLHDIGKIGIPDAILLKPGRLTDDEYLQVKQHPVYSEDILRQDPFLRPLAAAVRAHHECYDGKGYPDQVAGLDIPLEARVIAVVDTYETITARRPYKEPLHDEVARRELERVAGAQLDPQIVEAFLQIPMAQIEALNKELFSLEKAGRL